MEQTLRRNWAMGFLSLLPTAWLAIAAPASAMPENHQLAQILPPDANCARPTDALTRRFCSQQAYEAADAQLKRTYQQVMDALVPNDAKVRLNKAQIAWYEYRESDCAFLTYDVSAVSAVEEQTRLNQCRERLTRDRTQVLQAYLGTLTGAQSIENYGAAATEIEDLADGNYRYTSARPTSFLVSDAELLQNGGSLFWFRKQGDRVVGAYGLVDGAAVCLQGKVNGNTITGLAFPADGVVENTGDVLTEWDPAGFLRVRRGRPNLGRYDGAILDLSRFQQINAGDQTPPSRCPLSRANWIANL